MNAKIKGGLALLIVLVVWLVWPKKEVTNSLVDQPYVADSDLPSKAHRPRRTGAAEPMQDESLSRSVPQGQFEHIFDKAGNRKRFLFGKGHDEKFRPHSDAASGMDLWFQDESGEDRLIHGSVTRAKFSPDGEKVAYTTSDGDLHVEDMQGRKFATVPGVYGPSWKSDGTAVIYSKVGEGQEVHRPGTRRLASTDITTGETRNLTEGQFDDGRPEFSPSNEWVLFVSGARTGMASFWKVPAEGGKPVQLTNLGQQQVNELFVPTPYERTMWSDDKRWFVYDHKSGDQQETWGLEFNHDGTLKKATKLADGINPQFQPDGRTFVCQKTVDGAVQTITASLP